MDKLVEECTEKMLAYSKKMVIDYLREAKDHKVIHERTDDNGLLTLYMTYSSHVMDIIVNDDF